ncbi:hypothetical protein TEA_029101 [Camellia sinensis var. sinensis]|uniref:Uncharacterized protein n=1 Tax=Camellia sinensis var. sinensis TaxID=542762 RepID=A0A4V3WLX5_CAMSN|nr:hypothetical protein TEA_029101 [Camellia sinensis var. sinensis]
MEVGEGREGWVTATGGESVEEWGCRGRVVQKHILIRNSLNRYNFLWFLSSVFKFGSGATNEVLGCAIMVITTASARADRLCLLRPSDLPYLFATQQGDSPDPVHWAGLELELGEYNPYIILTLPHGKVCFRWVYEQGVSILVNSFNKDRIKENLDIFDWMLSPKESKKIDQIPWKKGCLGIEFISDQGPYKSVEELWDENI